MLRFALLLLSVALCSCSTLTISNVPTAPTFGALPAIQVAVTNIVNSGNGMGQVSVSLSDESGVPTSAATLGGTLAVPVVNGLAVFSDLTVNNAGKFTLVFSHDVDAVLATSTAFTVQYELLYRREVQPSQYDNNGCASSYFVLLGATYVHNKPQCFPCTPRVSSVTIGWGEGQSAEFFLKKTTLTRDGLMRGRFELNSSGTKRCLPPSVTPYSPIGLQSVVVDGVTFNFNQKVRLIPFENPSSDRHTRVIHHMFIAQVTADHYIQVVVQEVGGY